MTDDFPGGMPFLGGARWLDLLNSTLSMDGVSRLDFLADDASFARWCEQAGIPASGARKPLVTLRMELRPAFERLAQGKPLAASTVKSVNRLLAASPMVEHLVETEEGHALVLRPAASRPGAAAIVARDFAQFVAAHETARLKHCANPACTMVFYDQGKSVRRRWCSSAVCGNRDKVANYRARKTAGRD